MKSAVLLPLAGALICACVSFMTVKLVTEYTYRSLVAIGDVE